MLSANSVAESVAETRFRVGGGKLSRPWLTSMRLLPPSGQMSTSPIN